MRQKNKNPSYRYENILRRRDKKLIVGLDEVGRGAFAGPLVAAAVILPEDFKINGIKDSKLLTPKKREFLSKYILDNALFYAISTVAVEYVNRNGVGRATHKAFRTCLNQLKGKFDFVLVDGFKVKKFNNSMQMALAHGDSISVSVAAASIIAKVYRDNLMRNLDNSYPGYNFFQNKGYGTKFHQNAIKKLGFCKLHRTSFNLNKFL